MRGVVADVHFPENAALGHLFEKVIRVVPDLLGKGKQIGMRHACTASAPLGKAEQVALCNRLLDGVNVLDQAIVKERNVVVIVNGVAESVQGADLNAAQHGNLILILLAQQVDVIVIPPEATVMILAKVLVLVKKHVQSLAADAVVVIGDANDVKAACNRALYHRLGLIRAAK